MCALRTCLDNAIIAFCIHVPWDEAVCYAQTTGGRNGYGAKLANIFSTRFVIETCDGKRKRAYKQVFSDNMSTKGDPVITPCKVRHSGQGSHPSSPLPWYVKALPCLRISCKSNGTADELESTSIRVA